MKKCLALIALAFLTGAQTLALEASTELQGDTRSFVLLMSTEDHIRPTSVIQTADDGYAIAGTVRIDEGGIVLKLDAAGNLEWSRVYGSVELEFWEIAEIPDGYLVAGSRNSSDGALFFLDSSGEVLREDFFQGEKVKSVAAVAGGGFVLALENDRHDTLENASVAGFDSDGKELWRVSSGGTRNDFCTSVIVTDDGGTLLSGEWGDPDGCDCCSTPLILSTDSEGEVVWSGNNYGWINGGCGTCVHPDGGYLLGGFTELGFEASMVRLDNSGSVEWETLVAIREYDSQWYCDVMVVGNSSCVGVGRTDYGGIGRILVVEIDGTGVPIRGMSIGIDGFFDIESACGTSDGGLVAAGNGYMENHDRNVILVLKLAPDLTYPKVLLDTIEFGFEPRTPYGSTVIWFADIESE